MDKQKFLYLVIGIVLVSGIVIYSTTTSEVKIPASLRTEKSENSEKCIITVRGGKYDVSEFRNKHQGGDIFKCGEDMTSLFNNQHGEKEFRKLQNYKISE